MKIAIITAMEEEAAEIKNKLKNVSIVEVSGCVFYCGQLYFKDIVLSVSGIGKVAAAILLTTLVSYFKNIDKIINIGVAGGVLGKTKKNDVVVANNVMYHDVDLTFFSNYSYGQLPNNPAKFECDEEIIYLIDKKKVLFGTIVSGDRFMSDKEDVLSVIHKSFNKFILAFDMESAAFAQCAYYFKIPFTSIRSISDVIGETSRQDYDKNLENACKKVTSIVTEVIKEI